MESKGEIGGGMADSNTRLVKPDIVHNTEAVPIIKLPPEKLVTDYIMAKLDDTLAANLKEPEWDVPRDNPETKLIEVRREFQAAEKVLAEKKKETERRRKELDCEWKELKEQEDALRGNFIKYHKFVKQNEQKTARTLKKISEDLALMDKKTEEIENMKVTLERLEEIKQLMEQHVKDYHIYEDYLEELIKYNEPRATDVSKYQSNVASQFKTTNDIIHRYETLIAARDDLLEREKEVMESLEKERKRLAQIEQEEAQTLIGLNNELATLHVKYDQALANTASWESTLTRIKQSGSQKTAELGQVRAATWSMYQEVCRQKGEPVTIAENNTEAQLNTIKEFLLLTEKIIAKCATTHKLQMAS